MPQDHARTLRERTPLTGRQKRIAGCSAALVVVVTVVVILLTTGGKTQLGCINTYLPGIIGTQPVHECGQEARQTCATVKGAKQYGTVGVLIMEKACRAGHLSVG